MIVWVLILTYSSGGGVYMNTSALVVDNIATAASCEQLAKVARKQGFTATCAPVRKALVK